MVSSRNDLKLLRNPSCDSQNLFRLGAAINFDRYANENSLPPPPAARRLAPARACLGQVLSNKKETVTKTVTVSFWQGQKDLVSPAGSVGASALRAEVSTGDPHPSTRSACLGSRFVSAKNGHLSASVSFLAGAEGLEPSARGFGDHCSTN